MRYSVPDKLLQRPKLQGIPTARDRNYAAHAAWGDFELEPTMTARTLKSKKSWDHRSGRSTHHFIDGVLFA
jgi:hypothetical protein